MFRFFRNRNWILILSLLLSGELTAQTKEAKFPAPASLDPLSKADPAANQAWSGVDDAFTGRTKVSGLARADLARNFYLNFPQHPRAVEARKLEVLALLDAGASNASGSRLYAAAHALRNDPNVPDKDRAIVAGFYDLRLAAVGLARSENEFTVYETVARALTVEFPRQPQGYETLLTLAAQKGNPHGLALARELAASSAPDGIVKRAQRLAIRLNLTGKKLSQTLPMVAAAQPTGSGKLTIVYTWSTLNAESILLAQQLAQLNVGRAQWIGVNLDLAGARSAAEKLASDGRFPGVQIYDDRGPDGTVAVALGVDSAPVAFFVGSDGVIVDVHAAGSLLKTLPYFGL
jgi:hypothetical protein